MYLGFVLLLISMLSGFGVAAAAEEEVIKTGHITSCGG